MFSKELNHAVKSEGSKSVKVQLKSLLGKFKFKMMSECRFKYIVNSFLLLKKKGLKCRARTVFMFVS